MKRFILILALPSLAFGQGELEILVPRVVPNATTALPFLLPGTSESARYQQVYAASAFSDLGFTGGYITRLETKIVANGGSGCPGTSQLIVQINFSTTLRTPDHLSMIFSENVGLDDTVVMPRGALLNGGCSIQFATPFFYNPALGNLLLDVRTYQGYCPGPVSYGALAAENERDSVSSIAAIDVNATQAEGGWTGGVWTTFHIIPVPEPSTLALLGLGIVILGCRFMNRKKERERTLAQ